MLSESYSTYARNSFAYLQHNKLSVLTILLFPLFRYAYLDYQGWYALGGGGIPHNVFGWLVQSLLRLRASRNVRDSSCYDVAMKATELERTSFLDDQLPAWTGNTPKTGVWVAPHRQLEQFASSEIKKVGIFFFVFFCFRPNRRTVAQVPILTGSLSHLAGSTGKPITYQRLESWNL